MEECGGESLRPALARLVVVGEDRHAFDVIGEFVAGARRSSGCTRNPNAATGGEEGNQSILDAFRDRDREQVVRRRQHNRPAARWAEHGLVALGARLAGAVSFQPRDVHAADFILCDCENAGLRRLERRRPRSLPADIHRRRAGTLMLMEAGRHSRAHRAGRSQRPSRRLALISSRAAGPSQLLSGVVSLIGVDDGCRCCARSSRARFPLREAEPLPHIIAEASQGSPAKLCATKSSPLKVTSMERSRGECPGPGASTLSRPATSPPSA